MILQSKGLVVVGRWNVAILSPDWIVKEILEKPEADVTVSIPFSFPTPISYTIDEVTYRLQSSRIELLPPTWSEANLQRVERIASSILLKLPHTPIAALGMNFEFQLEEYENKILRPFDIFNDLLEFMPSSKGVRATQIVKSIAFEDCTLNLHQTYAGEGSYSLLFNYNYDVTSGISPGITLDGTKFAEKRAMTLKVLEKRFGVEAGDVTEAAAT